METKTAQPRISNEEEMKDRIRELERVMRKQQFEMKRDVKEVYYSLHPSHILKNAFREMKKHPGFKKDAAIATLDLGSQWLLDRFTFRRGGWKSFLLKTGLKKLASFAIFRNREKILKKAGLSRES